RIDISTYCRTFRGYIEVHLRECGPLMGHGNAASMQHGKRGLNTGNSKADALRDEADNARREQTRPEISYAAVDEKNQLLITNLWLKLEGNKTNRDVFSIDSCHLHEQHEIRDIPSGDTPQSFFKESLFKLIGRVVLLDLFRDDLIYPRYTSPGFTRSFQKYSRGMVTSCESSSSVKRRRIFIGTRTINRVAATGYCQSAGSEGASLLGLRQCFLEWNDVNMRWNVSEYGGVRDLRIPPGRLWKPDVLMYNR
ncbi:Acetylcholine receptor subunit alpha-type acr-16, partial [Cyphomyrmex costatus]